MTKSEIVAQIAKNSTLTRANVEEVITAYNKVLVDAMTGKTDEPVYIRELGTFTTKLRAPMSARRIDTGEPIQVPETLVPVFKVSSAVKGAAKANTPAK